MARHTHNKPFHPHLLQWNSRGLPGKVNDLRCVVSKYNFHAMLLQEPFVRSDFCFPHYVSYFSTTCQPDRRPRASIFVRKDIVHVPIDLSHLCSASVEFAACKLQDNKRSITVISVYRSGDTAFNASTFDQLLTACPGHLLIGGDINAKHPFWGNSAECYSGRAFATWLTSSDLTLLNNGSPTYHRPPDYYSALDITLVSPGVSLHWGVQPDTWSSDHYPIFLTPINRSPTSTRRHRITNWNHFRSLTSDLCQSMEILEAIKLGAEQSTQIVQLSSKQPRPDLKYLSLRASRRRAQRRAQRTQLPSDLTAYKKVSAAFRRYTARLRRCQWQQFASSLNPHTPTSVVWKVASSMQGAPAPTRPLACLALQSNLSLYELANAFADTLSTTPVPASLTDQPTPVPTPQGPADDPFTLVELKNAIRLCSRKSSPGSDGVSYQMLKNLGDTALLKLLSYYNTVWLTSSIPSQWKHAKIIPIPKPGKSPTSINNFRPIALTSAIGKVLERMVKRRLCWLLDTTCALPFHLCAYRKGRSSSDALLQLTTELYHASSNGLVSVVLFLDVQHAFDNLSHASLFSQLTQLGIHGRLGAYIRSYLTNRTFSVYIDGHTSTSRLLTSGVPQGGVLSPILFNIAMSDLHQQLPPTPYPPHFIIYADDICVRLSGKLKPRLETSAQTVLDHLDSALSHKGLCLSSAKSVALPCASPGKRIGNTFPLLTLQDNNVRRVTKARYLGVYFDSRLQWSPQVQHLAASCTPVLNVLKRLCGFTWGNHPHKMLTLYRSLILSRLRYSLPFIDPSHSGWLRLERIHRQGLRIALGLPSFSNTLETLAEAAETTLKLHSVDSACKLLARIYITPSSAPILQRIKKCTGTHAASLCRQLFSKLRIRRQHGASSPPPWRHFFPAVVTRLPGLGSKKNTAPVVARTFAIDHMDNHYRDFLHIYTDGSISSVTNTASSAYFIPTSSTRWATRLRGKPVTSTTAELCAILHAVIAACKQLNPNTVIFTDSASALHQLVDLDSSSTLVSATRAAISLAHQQGISLILQWIPSHVGIPGNEEADRLANAAHFTPGSAFPIPPSVNLKPVIQKVLTSYSQHHAQTTVPKRKHSFTRGLDRAVATALHRLRTNSARTHSMLYRLNLVTTDICPTCGVEEETLAHILQRCGTYHQERLKYLPHLLDGTANIKDYLFGDHSHASALASFLKETSLLLRL